MHKIAFVATALQGTAVYFRPFRYITGYMGRDSSKPGTIDYMDRDTSKLHFEIGLCSLINLWW
jgi:hypothetical protein